MTTSYDLGALKQPDEVGAGRDPRDIILPQPGFKTVLANRDFRLIWSAQVASQLADKFLMFALLILTYSISRASTHGAALFLAYTFPSVFLSPLAGVYADRHDKKRLMFFTNAIRGGLILLIPLSQVTPLLRARHLAFLRHHLSVCGGGADLRPGGGGLDPVHCRRRGADDGHLDVHQHGDRHSAGRGAGLDAGGPLPGREFALLDRRRAIPAGGLADLPGEE